jgi:hypothetical protein
MKIDRKLNLVIPVETEGGVYYVHSQPIGAEVFDVHYMVLAKTFAAIYSEGLGAVAAPRVASRMLRDVAKSLEVWEGPEGVEKALMGEIRRLTNILLPGSTGWESIPLHTAVARDFFTKEEVDEVEGAVTFFTVLSAMHRKSDLERMLQHLIAAWHCQTTSSNSTVFASSLTTPIGEESSGEKVPLSSIPS